MGESIYRCKKCGEERLGVALYECDNPECDDMYCGVCRPKGDYCGCSWEYSLGDDDDGTETRYGHLSFIGQIEDPGAFILCHCCSCSGRIRVYQRFWKITFNCPHCGGPLIFPKYNEAYQEEEEKRKKTEQTKLLKEYQSSTSSDGLITSVLTLRAQIEVWSKKFVEWGGMSIETKRTDDIRAKLDKIIPDDTNSLVEITHGLDEKGRQDLDRKLHELSCSFEGVVGDALNKHLRNKSKK